MKNFQRKLIFEDNALHSKLITAGEILISIVNQLSDSYKFLELGDFNQQIYISILSDGVKSVEEKYNMTLNNSIELLGLKNQIVIDNILAGSYKYFSDFQTAFLKVKKGVSVTGKPFGITVENEIKFPNELIKMQNGRGYLTDSNSELIKERYCRLYLEDPDQEQLFSALEAFSKVYNDLLLPAIEKVRYSHHFEGLYALDTLFLEDSANKKISIMPEVIPYVSQYNAWKENINALNLTLTHNASS